VQEAAATNKKRAGNGVQVGGMFDVLGDQGAGPMDEEEPSTPGPADVTSSNDKIAGDLMAKLKLAWDPKKPKATNRIRAEMAAKCKGLTANKEALGELATLGFTKNELKAIFVASE